MNRNIPSQDTGLDELFLLDLPTISTEALRLHTYSVILGVQIRKAYNPERLLVFERMKMNKYGYILKFIPDQT